MSKKLNILIIDDEPDILELIEYNLKKEGYQVYLASNGADGVAMAKKVHPDLIILDIMMPKMDGIEACRIMRAIPEFKNTFMVEIFRLHGVHGDEHDGERRGEQPRRR